jgi:osmotically-inducible protein OsmY
MRIRQRWLCSANLHGQNMEVQVKKGRVTLTGTVDTWLEREEAILDAYEAGACEVTDQLCTLGFF